jgi:hypothetical protein
MKILGATLTGVLEAVIMSKNRKEDIIWNYKQKEGLKGINTIYYDRKKILSEGLPSLPLAKNGVFSLPLVHSLEPQSLGVNKNFPLAWNGISALPIGPFREGYLERAFRMSWT